MVFVGLTTLANYIIFRFFPNILPANIVPQMAQLAWYLPLVGALERVLAIAIQIALSILIMYAFISKRYYIIFITMVFHMFVDFVAFYINYKFGFWFAEAAVAVFAVISIIILIRLKPSGELK